MKKHLLLLIALCLTCISQVSAQCTINAGPDQQVCANNSLVNLSAASVGASVTTHLWTTTGTGTFSSSTVVNPVYTPSVADIQNNVIRLICTGNGCGPVSDTLTVTITPAPTSNAGPDQSFCKSSNPGITLTGTITLATGGNWSTTGGGTFSNANSLTPLYTLGTLDTANAKLIFVLNTTGNGICNSATDTMIVNMVNAAYVDAGPDLTSCSNTITLTPTVYNTGAQNWITTGTGTFNNPNLVSPVYSASAADLAAGSVTFTLTSIGTCGLNNSDQLTVNFTTPVSNAGPDQVHCKNSGSTITLSGSVSGATGGHWSVNGGGTFSNPNSLTPVYTLGPLDTANAKLSFVLNTTGNGACSAATDTMVVTMTNSAYVNAGLNQTVCGNTATLSGTVYGSTAQLWTTSGTGTFSSTTVISPTYTASVADLSAGSVTLTLTSVGTCGFNNSDQVVLNFVGSSVANAGPDQSVCGNQATISGIVAGATGGVWSTTGTGSFSPSPNYLFATYIASIVDITSGTVTLTLTTTGGQACSAASDALVVTLTSGSQPTVNAGVDQIQVSGNVTLNGSVTNAVSGIWTTTGTGTFSPATTSLNATYTPSPSDLSIGILVFKLTTTGTGSCPSAYDFVTVTLGTTYSISGTVYAGANTLDAGSVSLFKYNGTAIDYVKQIACVGGQFTLDSLSNGEYYIQASPGGTSTYQSSYLPTYFSSASTWTSATPILINNANSTGNTIDLIAYTTALPTWNTGTDVISGVLTMSNPNLRTSSTTPVPIANATVYLKDISGNVIAFTQTSQNGSYTFSNLIASDYIISSEFGGTTISSPLAVTADGNSNTVENANLSATRTDVTTGILNGNSDLSITISPNPANSTINLNQNLSGAYSVKVTDMSGVIKIEQSISESNGSLSLNIEELLPGMYIVQVSNNNFSYSSKLIKY